LTRRELVQACGEWLNSYPWDWYAMLTFRQYPVGPKTAWHKFNDWKVELKKATGNPISYFMVRELPCWSYHPHYHIFLSGTKNEKPYQWKQRWYQVAGIAKIEIYDPQQDASYYLGAKWVDDTVDVKLSYNLAPRLK
jgi:hypothetical protein